MIGLNISAGLNSVITIYILIPLILVPQLLLGGAMIHFDDLHKSLTHKEYVPVVGDLMTTRWAYEAMAVEQFKNNVFEKLFFEQEQTISSASYVTSFLIPQLEIKIEECFRIIGQEDNESILAGNLTIIQNELNRLYRFYDFYPYEGIEDLTRERFTAEVGEQTAEFLNLAKIFYSEMAQEANNRKDNIYNRLTDSLGADGAYQFKQIYYNNKLADIVTNRTAVNKIVEMDDRLVRKKDPVFMMPESNVGRAHFYAPFKMINGRYIETKWFNLFFIWLTSIVFYLTLIMDLLRKVITYFEKIKLRKGR